MNKIRKGTSNTWLKIQGEKVEPMQIYNLYWQIVS